MLVRIYKSLLSLAGKYFTKGPIIVVGVDLTLLGIVSINLKHYFV